MGPTLSSHETVALQTGERHLGLVGNGRGERLGFQNSFKSGTSGTINVMYILSTYSSMKGKKSLECVIL